MRAALRIAATLIIAAATFTVGIFLLGAFNIIHPATAAASPQIARASCTMMFDSRACLDPSNIDDQRTMPDRIEEDDPRWDCAKLGNRLCGDANSSGRTPGQYR